MLWPYAQVEDSGSIIFVIVLLVVALSAGGAFFYLKQKQGPEPEKPQLSKEVPVWRQQATDQPKPAQPLNAAAAARAQIKSQLGAEKKAPAPPAPVAPVAAATPEELSPLVYDLIHEADHLRETNHHNIALQKLRDFLAKHPSEPAVLEKLGDVLVDGNDHHYASEAYSESARLQPSARVFDKLGKAHESAGDMPQAIAAYRSATVADPTDYKAFNNLGGLLAETGDVAGGVSAFRRAVELNPTDAALKENLAIAEEMLRTPSGGVRA